jgi:translation initiation factor IF-1
MLGGSNCHVKCVDGVSRLCVIRGKFRGKGKRDNALSVGSMILVGMRDYESCKGKDKLETCDLLEVYRESDKTRLFSSVKIDWSEIVTTSGCAGEKASAAASSSEELVFMTDEQIELERLILEQTENILARTNRTKTNTVCSNTIQIAESRAVFGDDDDDVEVDDI